MAKYSDSGNYAMPHDDISLDGYIRKYFIEPSENHAQKCPIKILWQLDFMGDLTPIQFWCWLFEQPKPGEDKHVKGWGYASRIANYAAKFVLLNQRDQEFILKARRLENPIWWRGEIIESFKAIAKESHRFNQLSESEKRAYRHNAFKQAMGLVNAKAA